jgi:hypothetical protein
MNSLEQKVKNKKKRIHAFLNNLEPSVLSCKEQMMRKYSHNSRLSSMSRKSSEKEQLEDIWSDFDNWDSWDKAPS